VESLHHRYILLNGINTHYVEAGDGPPLVLLHSGEFGACAELSWERNIPDLSKHFHVLAPDWLGYGETDKVFFFDKMRERRIDHIAAFTETVLSGAPACFVGNSMGGTILLEVAASAAPAWRMKKIVSVAGGGDIPNNAARSVLNSYEGSREHMAEMVKTMFVNPEIRGDEAYIDRRHRLSMAPGAWECVAAVRFKAPWRTEPSARVVPDYARISVPTLIVTGGQDCLREPDFGRTLQTQIPDSRLYIIKEAGHCPQIDAPSEFNAVLTSFLGAP
jgi:2-hydroxymuconate-semialdehyde hydrolase